ncbi:hypothetical protein F0U61_14600 [Archangium violaceum]|uniref:imm11 family protein n=1 Tax=Archangium violaceum TaxID=83451 RepID=UPI002B2FEAC7|nr:hypothetical protein F0U61_14600 [Archangium violaceum]
MRYFPWLHDDEDDSFAWIMDTPKELMEKDYLLHEGTPCKDWFPEGLVFDLSKDHGSKLTDCVPNTDNFLIVSEKLKGVLESHDKEDPIEFLPIRLRNPKKKLVAAPYFIANVLGAVPCMNKSKSKFTMDAIDKEQVAWFEKLVLEEKKIPKKKTLFRLGEKTTLLITREDLAREILTAKCNGMMFIPMEDYGEEFRSDEEDENEES